MFQKYNQWLLKSFVKKILRWILMFCVLRLQTNVVSTDMKSIWAVQTLFSSINTNRKAPTNAAMTRSSWLQTISSPVSTHCVKNNLMLCFVTWHWKTRWELKNHLRHTGFKSSGFKRCSWRGRSRADFLIVLSFPLPPPNFSMRMSYNDTSLEGFPSCLPTNCPAPTKLNGLHMSAQLIQAYK